MNDPAKTDLDRLISQPLTRRRMLGVTLSAAAAAALAACGISSSSTPSSGSTAPASGIPATAPVSGVPATVSPKRKVLRVWDAFPADYSAAKVMQEEVWARFKAKYPDMQLEYTAGLDPALIAQKFVQATAIGQAPDFFYNYASRGELWLAGYLYPVDDLLTKIGVAGDFYDGSKEMWRIQGKVYGIPTMYGTKCYLYRKDLLDQAGLPTDAPATTWEEFQQLTSRLAVRDSKGKFTHDGYVYYATSDTGASSEQVLSHAFQNGGSEFVGDEVIGQSGLTLPETQEAFTWFMDLIRKSRVQSPDGPIAPDEVSELGAGLCTVELQGPWQLPNLESSYPGLTSKLMVGPPLKRKQLVGIGNAGAWSINSKSDILEETLDYATFFLNDDLYKLYHERPGWTSARKSTNSSPDFWMAKNPLLQGGAYIDAFNSGRDVGNKHVGYGEIYSSAYARLIEQAINQTADDQTLLKEAAAAIDVITEKVKKGYAS